jgi:myo-inositol-1(or 4)-monophosphatase
MTAEMLETARAAVRAASELLAEARPHAVRGKGNPRDLVTEWDLRTEELIRTLLEERAPGIPVLGEEGGQGAGSGELRWLVDPIDGTVNFAHGLPIWSISIALEQAGELQVGVVAAPLLGWWFEASRGGGARDGRGAPLAVSAIARLDQSLLTTGFPYDRATNPKNNFADWEHMQRTAGACRRLGCASLDLCVVARGWVEGYWERHVKPWDVAAGVLIVREAGGTVTKTTGEPFDLHGEDVAASNGAMHDELIAELGRVQRPAR